MIKNASSVVSCVDATVVTTKNGPKKGILSIVMIIIAAGATGLGLVGTLVAQPASLTLRKVVVVGGGGAPTSPNISPRKASWNSTQLLNWLNQKSGATQSSHVHPYYWMKLLEEGPIPADDTVQIYNLDAWHRLRTLLLGIDPPGIRQQGDDELTSNSTIPLPSPPPRSVVLCSNGGSATAGGGDIRNSSRWDVVFDSMIQFTREQHLLESDPARAPAVTLKLVNRAHGFRGSLHSAFLMHSFLPMETNILIWEFSINDVFGTDCAEINNTFVSWLNQVARYFSPPPLVIVAYIWSRGFPRSPTHDQVADVVWKCHQHLASQYDFVVGSVSLSSYLNHLNVSFPTLRQSFVADKHHPNRMGHLILAYLLWDLVTNKERTKALASVGSIAIKTFAAGTRLASFPNFTCHRTPEAKNKVVTLLNEKYAVASWTIDEPRNLQHQIGMIYPQLVNISQSSNKLGPYSMNTTDPTSTTRQMSPMLQGRASELRSDRQYALPLPCCSTGERLSFDLLSLFNDYKDRNSNNRDNNMSSRRTNIVNNNGKSDTNSTRMDSASKVTNNISMVGLDDHYYYPVSALQIYVPHATTTQILSTRVQVDFLWKNKVLASSSSSSISFETGERGSLVQPATQNASYKNKRQQQLHQPTRGYVASATCQWVVFPSGECSVHNVYENTWLVLPKPTRVSRINLCGTTCDQTLLTHIAVF